MDKLPPEVFEIILPQVGGCAFLSLRRTCKRLKTLVDYMEMTLTPCIWNRYIYEDFSTPCVNSLFPWLQENEENIEKDSIIWKTIYSCMFQSKVNQHSYSVKEVTTVYHESPDCIFFAGQQLILLGMDMACAGLSNEKKPMDLMPITNLRDWKDITGSIPIEFRSLSSLYPPPPVMKDVIYKPFNIADQTNSLVTCCKAMVEFRVAQEEEKMHTLIPTEPPFPVGSPAIKMHRNLVRYAIGMEKDSLKQWELEWYESKILLFGCRNKIWFCHRYSSISDGTEKLVCSCDTLQGWVKSIRIIGNLLIGLFVESNTLMTNVMQCDDAGQITLGEWRQLFMCGQDFDRIVDFDFVGQAFVAITDTGKVFMCNLEELSHEYITKNIFLAHVVSSLRPPDALYRVCLDVNNGLVIALMGTHCHLTLLFVD